MITSKALTAMGVRHFVVVEPQEVDAYRAAIKKMNLLAEVVELDMKFKETYELCDKLGLTKSTGPGPARNFAWEHSKSNGDEWHWVMDDNIRAFRMMNAGQRIKASAGAFWTAQEDFVLRYENVAMAGPNYTFFAPPKKNNALPPFITNTRIYSCNFIRNEVPFRWRGRYNEDTILSLDLLKAGWCTIQFNAFLQDKIQTQQVPGGNTQEFYHAEGKLVSDKMYAVGGTDAKSKMLVAEHPDCCRIVLKYGRTHHHVDYRRFKDMALIPNKRARRVSYAEKFKLQSAEG